MKSTLNNEGSIKPAEFLTGLQREALNSGIPIDQASTITTYSQLQAIKAGMEYSKAMTITSIYQLQAFQNGVQFEILEEFKSESQIKALAHLKGDNPTPSYLHIYQAKQFTNPAQVAALKLGIDIEKALQFSNLCQIHAFQLGASESEALLFENDYQVAAFSTRRVSITEALQFNEHDHIQAIQAGGTSIQPNFLTPTQALNFNFYQTEAFRFGASYEEAKEFENYEQLNALKKKALAKEALEHTAKDDVTPLPKPAAEVIDDQSTANGAMLRRVDSVVDEDGMPNSLSIINLEDIPEEHSSTMSGGENDIHIIGMTQADASSHALFSSSASGFAGCCNIM